MIILYNIFNHLANIVINKSMKIDPKKLVLIGAIIALNIAEDKSLNEINTYKNLFSTIASNLQSIVNQTLFNK